MFGLKGSARMRTLYFVPAIVLAIMMVIVLAGCGTWDSTSSYFQGAVTVHYHKSDWRDDPDYLSIMFYQPGTYKLSFSPKIGTLSHESESFDQGQRRLIVPAKDMPSALKVTIADGSQSETETFS